MDRGPIAAVLGALSLAVAFSLTGCSLNLFAHGSCVENVDCRQAFGRGWVCGDAGLCEAAEANPRCQSEPEGILDDLAAHEDHILLGNLFDWGDFNLMVRAARLAVIQVNTRDGLNGTPFGMIECTNEADFNGDGLDENEATDQLATYMSDVLGIPSIVGPATSTRTEIAYNISAPVGTLHVSPSATSPALTDIDGATSTDDEPGLLWRTAPPDSLQGRVIALEIIALGHERVGIAAQVGAYGEGLAQVFQENFNGGSRTSELSTFTDNSELGGIAADYGDAEFDAVLAISSSTGDMADFLVAASGVSGYDEPTKTIFLPDGAFDVQLIEESVDNASDLYPNVRGTVPSTPVGLAYDTFRASYLSVFNEDPADFGFSAHAYDAAWLVIAGAAWSELQEGGEVTGLGSARGLRQISSGSDFDTGPNDWNSVKAAFEAGNPVDLRGASGSLDFDDTTGETAAPVNVWAILETEPDEWELTVLYCVDVSASPSPQCSDAGGR